ncbi:hypothetical protein [Methylobacterium flocculans]|uniref:hypothetical protein n=1 Tax=Methylobacterium flocculans TaxID=2984843 RepID=UPI0021F2C612|nr:hypothetical protein [Methylobacterium sp. FF17]
MTSVKDRDQEFRRELVIRIGQLIHGQRWIAPLAADLAAVTGRSIKGPQISHWLSELRPFPEWVEDALLRVINDRIAAILHEGKRLRAESYFLQARFAARLVDTPDPVPDEDALMPRM